MNDFSMKELFRISLTFISVLFLEEVLLKPIFRRANNYEKIASEFNFLKEQYLLNINKTPHVSQKIQVPAKVFQIDNDVVKNELICVLNPVCSPCASHYIQAYYSLFSLHKTRISFCFTYWNEKQREMLNYMFKAIAQNPSMVREIIFDWYTIGVNNLNDFIEKYDCSNIDETINRNVMQNRDWCVNNHINVTPTFFYNGFKLPKGFSINDVINL